VSVGKKTRNKKYHDEFGDAVVNVPQQAEGGCEDVECRAL